MPHLKKSDLGNLNIWILIALILCGVALYFLPLQSKTFYFDDHFSIESNEAIKTIDIPKIFNAFNTRFLVGLSFAFNYQLCALNPAGYRLVNLLIHCLNAFLVYLLVRSTLYLFSARNPIFFCRLEWPAFFASMLFLCHPIQTEAVNAITQRFVLMGSFFYLLTLFLYIQYRCRKQKGYLIAGMISAIAAMFCKEFVVTLPLMLLLYDFYFSRRIGYNLVEALQPHSTFFVIVLIVPLLLLRTPSEAIGVANIADSDIVQEGSTQKVGSHIDITRAHNGISRKKYFLTEVNVMCTYVRLLFLPINQNLDYEYPISYRVDKKTALCGVFLLCLLALAAVTYKTYRIISFSILWFFIALSVESSFIPIGHVIAEYRLYLASVGFVFLVTSLIYMRKADVQRLNMIAAVILIGLSILTYQRNKIWKDELALWNDTVQKSPHKSRPYYNRGLIYDKQGNINQAISDYTRAIEINPGLAYAYNNRGTNYGQQGNINQAISDFNKAIEINPNYAEAYNNRGITYYKQYNLTQAMFDFNKAIKIDPKNPEAYYNRGIIYGKQGNFTQAISDFNQAIEINPDYAIEIDPKLIKIYDYRGLIYYKQGNYTQALSDYNKAIEIDPDNAESYNDRGSLYGNQGDLTQAMINFDKAIKINPKDAGAYNNRAAGYYALKEYGKAWADVRKAEGLGSVVNPDFINKLKQASVLMPDTHGSSQ